MIFSKEFDKALWLILYGDKRNREKIEDFVRSIPCVLYKDIHKCLVKFYEYQRKNVSIFDRDEDIRRECVVADSFGIYTYYFVVNFVVGTLSVGRIIDRDRDFEITLFYNNDSKKSGNVDERMLGSVYSSNFGNISYVLLNNLFGTVIESSSDKRFKRIRRVDKEMVINDVNISKYSL